MIISKELLSEVLNLNITNVQVISITAFYIYEDENEIEFEDKLNIYYLAHKCKEWAAPQGYNVSSNLVTTMITSNGYREMFDADTEPEAIFKACQWILDNIKNGEK